jgi:hypothetical protein
MKLNAQWMAATMFLAAVGTQAAGAQTLPAGIDALSETAVMKVYAEGAQV